MTTDKFHLIILAIMFFGGMTLTALTLLLFLEVKRLLVEVSYLRIEVRGIERRRGE